MFEMFGTTSARKKNCRWNLQQRHCYSHSFWYCSKLLSCLVWCNFQANQEPLLGRGLSVSISISSNEFKSQNFCKKIVIHLKHSDICILLDKKSHNDGFFVFYICLHWFDLIQVVIQMVKFSGKLAVNSFVRFFIIQIFNNSVSTPIQISITVRAIR